MQSIPDAPPSKFTTTRLVHETLTVYENVIRDSKTSSYQAAAQATQDQQ